MDNMLLHAVYCPRCLKPLSVRKVGAGRYVLECPYCGYTCEYVVTVEYGGVSE